jgi:thiamine biosynthesis lipoprotein
MEREPVGIMGTRSKIAVLVEGGERARGAAMLAAAEGELRRIEALMSTWIEASELSLLNLAPGGELVPLSAEVLALLRAAQELHGQTGGTFDVTCGPLIRLWREAGKRNRPPSEEEITAARAASSWADVELLPGGVRKARASVRFDVDGIAKGYAIDRALEALEERGALGGMVEVGGDLRAFGRSPEGMGWKVGIRDPNGEGEVLDVLSVESRAVCTSGDYARGIDIGGVRHSQLIDPRSGRPAGEMRSVTVLAGDALTADAWATALSVEGEEGLERLPEKGIEALLIPAARGSQPIATPDFGGLLERLSWRPARAAAARRE